MGTRGLWGFYKGGITKAAYNHYDSYPQGLGNDILKFINKTCNKTLNVVFNKVVMVNENKKPSKNNIERYSKYLNLNVNTQTAKDWYCLLRKTQGNPFVYLGDVDHMIDSKDFIHDSLFCEYAYIINLDENVLEFYTGFNKTPQPKEENRYSNKDDKPDDSGYVTCKLVLKIPFKDIRKSKKKCLDKMIKAIGDGNE